MRAESYELGGGVDIVTSRGAALRTGTAGSQDESRCSAIHKRRSCPEKAKSRRAGTDKIVYATYVPSDQLAR